jgi:hypothetical protein
MGKLLKTMSVPQLIAIAARLAARKGRRQVKVPIRPPYIPPECPRKVDSPFGVVSVYIKPTPNEKGEWEVFVKFPSLSNPVIPKEVGEDLLKLQ